MTIRRELFAGEVLYRQGDPSDCAWLVERGAIELMSVQGRRSVSHGVLGPGELIGELGMLDGAPRSATATARGDTVLLAIDHDQFLDRLDAGDPIVRTLVDSLLQRTRSIIASLPMDASLPAEDIACDDPEERSGIDKIRLEAQLHDALDSNTLEVRYQPIYDIRAGRVASYEALVRWELPDRGAVSPAEFIKLAEETSLIVPVGEYVLDRVLAVLTGLRDAGVDPLPGFDPLVWIDRKDVKKCARFVQFAIGATGASIRCRESPSTFRPSNWWSRAWRGRSWRGSSGRSCPQARSSSKSPKAACSTMRRSSR